MQLFKASALVAIVFVFGCATKQLEASIPAAANPAATTFVKDSAFSIVSVDRSKKTIYRGIKNPLTIVVPNAVSTKVEGNGIVKVDDYGHYKISPGSGTKTDIKITATMRDGSTFVETRSFNIRNLPNPKCVLRNTNLPFGATSISLTEDEIRLSEIGLQMPDFDYEIDFIVTGFKVEFPYGINIDVEGTKFSGKVLDMIKKMKHDGELKIHEIRTAPLAYGDLVSLRVDPLTIKVNKKARPKK